MEVYTGLLAVVELHYHQFTPFSISPNFFAQTAVFLRKKMIFLFHEDSQYTVWKYCGAGLKIDYTLRYLQYSCSVPSHIGRHGLSLGPHT